MGVWVVTRFLAAKGTDAVVSIFRRGAEMTSRLGSKRKSQTAARIKNSEMGLFASRASDEIYNWLGIGRPERIMSNAVLKNYGNVTPDFLVALFELLRVLFK